IDQPHVFAHALQRQAFQVKSLAIALVVVTRCAAKTEHRVLLSRFKLLATDEHRVLIRFEVGHAACPTSNRMSTRCSSVARSLNRLRRTRCSVFAAHRVTTTSAIARDFTWNAWRCSACAKTWG